MSSSKPAPRLTVVSSSGSGTTTALGRSLGHIRRRLGLTLKDISAGSGIPISTLSKVQNGQATLTYENLVKLATSLGVDVADLFRGDHAELRTTRRAIQRKGQGRTGATDSFGFEVLATELTRKRMTPTVLTVTATSFDQTGGLKRHEGEEFLYVVSGTLELHTEYYEPARLEAGDSAYLDSALGHAYVAVSKTPVVVLAVLSQAEPR
ncbi:DNA-binding transcriptional repressor PuuR [bacterium YEK0313]|nr:DNA-binding transcriptional repressor PuuR [bacterium YEK0313]